MTHEVPIGAIVTAIHKQAPKWMDPTTVQWFGTTLPRHGWRGAGELCFFATGERLRRGDPTSAFGIVRCVDLVTGQLVTVEDPTEAVGATAHLKGSTGLAGRSKTAAHHRAAGYARASRMLAGEPVRGAVTVDHLLHATVTHKRMGLGVSP
jgi:hypothetical protein